jgi:transcriptional regulator of acetoin/glycerol metabolism
MIHPAGDRHWTHQKPELIKRGAASHAAKLSAEDIESLCARFQAGCHNRSWLARKFGVSRITIWRHLKQAGLL